jgi:hypothetical protein
MARGNGSCSVAACCAVCRRLASLGLSRCKTSSSCTALKLVVDQRGGGLGTEAPQLQVGMRATELVFLARGTPPYTLALGNAGAKAAYLSLRTLIPGYQPARLSPLGLATVSSAAVTAAAPGVPRIHGPDWKRIVLWAVLLLGVGLLVLSLLRAAPAKS